MKISVITSFDKKYYDMIGKDCVESWLRYWPEDMKLTCYVEEFSMEHDDRIIQIPFSDLCQEYRNLINSNEKNRVKTFAKKAYSIIHAFENSDADYLIWLDADAISTKKLTKELLSKLCPRNSLSTFLGVAHDDKGTIYRTAETGVFSVNLKHPEFKNFAARYREYYDHRIKENLRRFYDGDVFGAVVEEFRSKAEFYDMCTDLSKGYKTPLKHTWMGPYIHHFKAKHSKATYSVQ